MDVQEPKGIGYWQRLQLCGPRSEFVCVAPDPCLEHNRRTTTWKERSIKIIDQCHQSSLTLHDSQDLVPPCSLAPDLEIDERSAKVITRGAGIP